MSGEHLASNNAAHPLDVPTLLARNAAAYGEAVALVRPEGGQMSHRTLHAEVFRIAGGLRPAGTHRPRIAVVVPNGADMSVALLAAMCAGVAVPFNPAYTPGEYAEYFRLARVDALLVPDASAHAALAVAHEMGLAVHALDQLRDPRRDGAGDLDGGFSASADELALVMLTSGSTGRSKLVPLTHRNLCTSARDVCRSLALDSSDRCLCMWEQFHIGGVVDLLLAPLLSGGEVIAAGSFDVSSFFELLERHRPTWYQGVPTTMHELQRAAQQRGYRSAGTPLRFLRCVAAALPEPWRLEIEATFGVPVVRTFGMTEASPLIASTRLPPAAGSPGAVGFPCGPEVCILAPEGPTLPAGVIGEVAVRGDNVFAGYEGQPELNAECFRDGWFLTGDLGYLDAQGQLFLTGRAKDIINRGGEKVSPGEVEAAFLSHPAVAQAVAFANPHPTLGEDVGIALVLKPDAAEGREAIEQHVAHRLAGFKQPRAWLFLEQMPRCAVGKVQRRELPRLYRESREMHPAAEVPKDALEAALLQIWRSELDNPRLGVRDQFADAGGDSLSSLRVVVAVEQAFDVALPDDVVQRCASVACMADELRGMGVSGTATAMRPVEGDDLLLAGYANEPVASMLFDASSARRLEVVRQALGSLTTPCDLSELLSYRPSLLDRLRSVLASPLGAVQLSRERRRMLGELRGALERAADPLVWQRTRLSEHVFLFSAQPGDVRGKVLVVGFTSLAMRLTAPTYQILCALDPARHALLLLRDPHRSHFEGGVPGVGDSVEQVADWLRSAAPVRACDEVVALGTSAGAVPALIAAVRNDWRRALLCGADDPARHLRLEQALDAALSTRAASAGEVVIAFSDGIARDRCGAEALARRLPHARICPETRFTHHALLHHLHLRGELRDFLAQHLFGAKPDAERGA